MQPTRKIPLPEKIAYGFGDLASCLYWQTFMIYLLFFYTDIFGISASAVGTMLLVARIWDGINDPMMGALADRTNTRWGKFRPYLLWMVGPFVLFGVLTFTTPELSMKGRLIWAYCTYIPLMMFYTAINIPYTAMLGVLSPDPVDRTVLSSVKFIFAFGGNLLIAFFLLPMTRALGGVNDWLAENEVDVEMWKAANPDKLIDNHPDVLNRLQAGWSYSFMVIAVMVICFFMITFLFTRERVKPRADQKTNLSRDIQDLISNKPWWILLATTISFILFTAIRSTVSAHYFKYFVGDQMVNLPFMDPQVRNFEWLVSNWNGAGAAASIAGVFLLPMLVKAAGKKPAFVILMLTAVLSTAGFFMVDPSDVTAMFVLQIIGSLTGGPIAALLWAMYADTADYSDWKRGRRATGLVFSASTMSQKYGWAFAAFFVGWMLDGFGFVANQVQNPEVIDSLRLMMSLIPAVVGLLSIGILYFYPLNDKRVNEISAELAIRAQQPE